jgi:hypothetical protein
MTQFEKARLLKEADKLVNKIDANIRYIIESIKAKKAKKAA